MILRCQLASKAPVILVFLLSESVEVFSNSLNFKRNMPPHLVTFVSFDSVLLIILICLSRLCCG